MAILEMITLTSTFYTFCVRKHVIRRFWRNSNCYDVVYILIQFFGSYMASEHGNPINKV